jgi:hypothetical protein
MNRLKVAILLAGLGCSVCAWLATPVKATNLTMDLVIQPRRCTLDTTATGLQPTTVINPKDCLRKLPQSVTTQQQTSTTSGGGGHRTTTSPAESSAKASSPSSHPANGVALPQSPLLLPQVNSQSFVATSLGVIVSVSIDVLVFNMAISQFLWRRLMRIVSYVLLRD